MSVHVEPKSRRLATFLVREQGALFRQRRRSLRLVLRYEPKLNFILARRTNLHEIVAQISKL
jgi:hypothetical protein